MPNDRTCSGETLKQDKNCCNQQLLNWFLLKVLKILGYFVNKRVLWRAMVPRENGVEGWNTMSFMIGLISFVGVIMVFICLFFRRDDLGWFWGTRSGCWFPKIITIDATEDSRCCSQWVDGWSDDAPLNARKIALLRDIDLFRGFWIDQIWTLVVSVIQIISASFVKKFLQHIFQFVFFMCKWVCTHWFRQRWGTFSAGSEQENLAQPPCLYSKKNKSYDDEFAGTLHLIEEVGYFKPSGCCMVMSPSFFVMNDARWCRSASWPMKQAIKLCRTGGRLSKTAFFLVAWFGVVSVESGNWGTNACLMSREPMAMNVRVWNLKG